MASLTHQRRASYAFFERNWNLTKRYWGWEIVWLFYNIINALSVVLIAKGANQFAGKQIITQAQ
ncbi:MAG: ABC transporter permease, partial [Ktedonobacteraceae bacterium]